MERQAADAMYAALHEAAPFHDGSFTSWAKERSRTHPYQFSEGVTVGVAATDLAPDDLFTTRKNASPVLGVVAEESPRDEDEAGGDTPDDRSDGDDQ